MSALLCGVGTSPGLYAPLRDLPHLNLRCWTNLAHEAGLGGRFFYGEDLSFDHYRDILQEHGFDYLYVANVNGRKRGGWGLSDRELFTDVLADQHTQGERAARGVVRGLLTLSTHSPFSVPEDMPEADEVRVRKLARRTTDRTEVVDHWITVSYLDDALARFVPRLMQSDIEQGRTPVVLLVGDHTSGLSISSAPLGAARIPGFWVLPPSLDAGPLSELQRELDERSWSQNDLARLMVELLEGSGQLDSLPPAARWHNVGGQQLADFSAPEPYQAARVWTLDTLARARLIDSSRRVLVEEALQTPRVVEDLRAQGIGKDASSALAWLVAHPASRGLCSL
jgi:hypothetical protein